MLATPLLRSVALATLVTLFGCDAEPSPIPTSTQTSALDGDGLHIDAWTNEEFAGVYESEKFGAVKFKAVIESDTKITAVAYVNETQIDLYVTADEGDGHVGFQVHGGILDEAAHGLLAGIHDAISERFPYPEEGMHEDPTPEHVKFFRAMIGYLSEAPRLMRDDVYDHRIEREPGRPTKPTVPPSEPPPTPTPTPACSDVSDNDGISTLTQCCNGGTTVPYQHDDLPGGHCFMTLSATCGLSSPAPAACAGRCGPNCNANPGYYQDCLDHDHCLVHDGGGSGITPADKCGDEWWEGVDDFVFAYAQFTPMFWWVATGFRGCN